ncbi:MAG: chloride channel protein [Candidatus Sumerlaeia bacterium]
MNGGESNSAVGKMQITVAGRTFAISRFTFLMIMGAVVGAATGLVTVGFRLSAIWGERILFPFHGEPGQLQIFSIAALKRLVMPAVGGLFTGFLIYKLGKFKGTHGVPAIMQSVASGQPHFKLRMAVPSALATITLATGGSAGPEGPIAEIGSITGSHLGRLVNMPSRLIKTMIGAGVAAGISAVFNAPIAGIFFALEVILRNYDVASFTPIAIASVVSSVIAHACLGDNMAIAVQPFLIPQRELPLFIVFGLLCGIVSIVYIRGLSLCHRRLKKVSGPMWLKPALGGLLVGLIGVFFPRVMGEGYDWMSRVIARPEGVGLMLLVSLLILKILATGITLGSGNPGGSFAPAVFIGVMGGAAFGLVSTGWGWTASAVPYAVMGVAGLISGALGAPFTAIMLALRHTAYRTDILMPLITTVALSGFVVQRFRIGSVYTHDMLRSGIDLDRSRQLDPLSLIKIGSIKMLDHYEELPASMSVGEALEHCKTCPARWFVVRRDRTFLGIISLHEMRMAISEDELARLLVLSDIVDAFIPRLHSEMTMRSALAAFSNVDSEALPVFASAAKNAEFIGVVSRQDVLDAYYRFTESV